MQTCQERGSSVHGINYPGKNTGIGRKGSNK